MWNSLKVYKKIRVQGAPFGSNCVTFYISKEGKILKIDDDITPKSAAQDMANNLAALGIAKNGKTQ